MELNFDPIAEVGDTCNVVRDVAFGEFSVQSVDKNWNETVREDFALFDLSFLHGKLDVDEGPVKPVLQRVAKVRRLPEAPVPLGRLIVDLHQPRHLPQVLLSQHCAVALHP